MKSIKNYLPNTTILEERLSAILSEVLPNFLVKNKFQIEPVKKYRKIVIILGFLSVGTLLLSDVLRQDYHFQVTLVLLVTFAEMFRYILHVRRFFALNALNNKLSKLLVEVFGKVLGLEIQHKKGALEDKKTIRTLLEKYNLLPETLSSVTIGDVYSVKHVHPMTIRELSVKGASGKRLRNIFRGYFVEIQLPKILQGETYISTEGDEFAEQKNRWWKNDSVQPTKLEWNQFENDLHVVTNNPVETREILTPDFMLDLHTWWQEDKKLIRITFKDDRMLVLFPEPTVSFGFGTNSSDFAEINEYAKQVLKSIWTIACLVEDVAV